MWQVGGRLVFAPIGRLVSSRAITILVYLCQVVAVALLAWSTSPAVIVLYVAGTGLSRGMYTLVRATLVAQLFGTRSYGAIAARLALGSMVAQAVGPLLGSAIHAAPGGYSTMLWTMAASAVVATLLAAGIERPITPVAAG